MRYVCASASAARSCKYMEWDAYSVFVYFDHGTDVSNLD